MPCVWHAVDQLTHWTAGMDASFCFDYYYYPYTFCDKGSNYSMMNEWIFR